MLTRSCQSRNGRTVLETSPAIRPSSYTTGLNAGSSTPPQLTTSTVRFWSDFSRVFYHPRSIVQINDYELASSILPFENWERGEELFRRLDGQGGGDSGEGIIDRDVRRWAEECDRMQGVQVWTGTDDAWGGFASRYTEALRDEMGKMGVWTWGIMGEQGHDSRVGTGNYSCNVKTIADSESRPSNFFEQLIPRSRYTRYRHKHRFISRCQSPSDSLHIFISTEIRNGIRQLYFRWCWKA